MSGGGIVVTITWAHGASRTAWVPMIWLDRLTQAAVDWRHDDMRMSAAYCGRVLSSRPTGIDCHIVETGLVRP